MICIKIFFKQGIKHGELIIASCLYKKLLHIWDKSTVKDLFQDELNSWLYQELSQWKASFQKINNKHKDAKASQEVFSTAANYVIEAGADVNYVFMKVIRDQKYNTDIIEFLIKKLIENPEELYKKNDNGYTVLYMLCRESLTDIVKKFLSSLKSLVNIKGNSGLAPLHIASYNLDPGIVTALLTVPGILVDAQDKYGHTLLHHAAGSTWQDVCRARTKKDDKDFTNEEIEKTKKDQIDTCKILLEKLPNLIGRRNKDKQTAYDMVLKEGNDHVAKFLSAKQKE